MGLHESLAAVRVSKPVKEEGKHYIPFSKKEWEELERVAGVLEPKDLKRMLNMIFKGEAHFILKGDLASLEKLVASTKAEIAAKGEAPAKA